MVYHIENCGCLALFKYLTGYTLSPVNNFKKENPDVDEKMLNSMAFKRIKLCYERKTVVAPSYEITESADVQPTIVLLKSKEVNKGVDADVNNNRARYTSFFKMLNFLDEKKQVMVFLMERLELVKFRKVDSIF